MNSLSRRELLGGSAALAALSAGCLNGGGLIGESEDPGGDDPAAGGPSDGDSTGGEDGLDGLSAIEATGGLESAGHVQYSHSRSPNEARAELFTSVEDAESWLENSQLDSDDPAATALIETDYGSARALAIEGQAPDGCHQLSITDVSLDDGAISVTASLEEDDDAGDMCTQQLTAEGAVVRATTTDAPPNEASVSLSLPDGATVGIGMETNTASESDSGTDSDDE